MIFALCSSKPLVDARLTLTAPVAEAMVRLRFRGVPCSLRLLRGRERAVRWGGSGWVAVYAQS